jgi:hypothetical protein
MDYSRQARGKGNPNTGDVDREASRLGSDSRTPADIPKQGLKTPDGTLIPGNVDESSFHMSTEDTGGIYRMGAYGRPSITHDHGFLALGRLAPTTADYIALAKWRAMLEGGELLRPDLTDALGAYRHFLEGGGRTRTFQYERYVMSDRAGQVTLRNANLEFQQAALELWLSGGKPRTFKVSGPPIPCGTTSAKFRYLRRSFPYPRTENWQKAIGSHIIWLSGDVTVNDDRRMTPSESFHAVMTLHAEDRYNFNPGANDIATKIPDAENGRFERTGLAHQYDNVATLVRVLVWRGRAMGVGLALSPNTIRVRQPNDNRNPGNRL